MSIHQGLKKDYGLSLEVQGIYEASPFQFDPSKIAQAAIGVQLG